CQVELKDKRLAGYFCLAQKFLEDENISRIGQPPSKALLKVANDLSILKSLKSVAKIRNLKKDFPRVHKKMLQLKRRMAEHRWSSKHVYSKLAEKFNNKIENLKDQASAAASGELQQIVINEFDKL